MPALCCVECSLVTNEQARGWRAYLTDEESGPVEIVVLCPACSEREFGTGGQTDQRGEAS